MRLRAAEPGDAAAVAELYRWHVENGFGTFEEEPPSTEEIARRISSVLERGLPWLLTEAGGELLGYAYAAPYRDRSGYRFTAETSVYMTPEVQRRGVGRALLSVLLERCAAQGFRRVIASIGDSDNTASIRLHEACGFEICGRLHQVGFKRGRWLDVVYLQKLIGT